MKAMFSYSELDDLAEELVKDYMDKKKESRVLCVDIEGFITEYMKMSLVYENIAEENPNRIGFLANGIKPLFVNRNGCREKVVFSPDTIVLDRYLLHEERSGQNRFTMAHECGHKIMGLHIPKQQEACFHTLFDENEDYVDAEVRQMFSLYESYANRMGAALLMPRFLLERVLKKYTKSKKIIIYGNSLFSYADKLVMSKMADCMGVSYSAFINRLHDLDLFEEHDAKEFIKNELHLGEVSCNG